MARMTPSVIATAVTEYLLAAANRYLSRPLEHADIISTYAGIRPLVARGGARNTASLSRDHTICVEASRLVATDAATAFACVADPRTHPRWIPMTVIASEHAAAPRVGGRMTRPPRRGRVRPRGWPGGRRTLG